MFGMAFTRPSLIMQLTSGVDVFAQGDHSPGKHRIVRELDSGQGKVRENGKSQGKLKITILQLCERKILPRFKDIKAGITVCKIMVITIVVKTA